MAQDNDTNQSLKDKADSLADSLIARRQAMVADGGGNSPLIVVIGEDHDKPAHYVFHMALMRRLADSGQALFCAFELPHNDSSESGAAASDPAAFMASGGAPVADHARMTLFNFLLARDIPAAFVDAAMVKTDRGAFLDAADDSTGRAIRDVFNPSAEGAPIPVSSADGLRIRNHHMAGSATGNAQAQQADIILHICGNMHVAGFSWHSHQFASVDSLAARYQQNGHDVAAVTLCTGIYDEVTIPAREILDGDACFFVAGLPEATAAYDPATDRPHPHVKADMTSRAAEAACLDALLSQAELAGDYLTPDDLAARRAAQRAPSGDPAPSGGALRR